ncbi:hypothetical protein BQ8794_180046 [Mesorhizobium prunaredense]|uniref:Uncharacterized protein n=1 Tax=Mesorhizobium prunaredense TaxID=1631249 RepID=A0A1R3V463_9HYPH|nr:hypothetical protein BQ8794_180046 [Mesorhizobium prunaredense]
MERKNEPARRASLLLAVLTRGFFAGGFEMERGRARLAPAAADFQADLPPHCPCCGYTNAARQRDIVDHWLPRREHAEPKLPCLLTLVACILNDGSPAAEVGLATTPMRPLERGLLARSADFNNAIKGTVQAKIACRALDNHQVGRAAPHPFPRISDFTAGGVQTHRRSRLGHSRRPSPHLYLPIESSCVKRSGAKMLESSRCELHCLSSAWCPRRRLIR